MMVFCRKMCNGKIMITIIIKHTLPTKDINPPHHLPNFFLILFNTPYHKSFFLGFPPTTITIYLYGTPIHLQFSILENLFMLYSSTHNSLILLWWKIIFNMKESSKHLRTPLIVIIFSIHTLTMNTILFANYRMLTCTSFFLFLIISEGFC